MATQSEQVWDWKVSAAVMVAALGYFVDAFDLVLFSVLRVSSLKSLGVSGEELTSTGVFLLNMQLSGLLIGGIFWGIWGDKRGRLSVLFGSITLYSLATIANGFVTNVPQYAVCRLLAGIGLAGELGAGITLVSEMIPQRLRGYGTTIIATVGVAGVGFAGLLGDVASWQNAYFLGGGMGLLLLVLRIAVHESGLFKLTKSSGVRCGDFTLLFRSRECFYRYINCILPGLPIWFVTGVIVTFSPEIAQSLKVSGNVIAGTAIVYYTIGIVAGDLLSGLLSQYLQSRKRAIRFFLGLAAIFGTLLLNARGVSADQFYMLLIPLGFAAGYWAVFITTAAEHFGTNMRATVTTTVPNFVRAAAVPMTSLFALLKPYLGAAPSAQLIGICALGIAIFSLHKMKETFHMDLNFIEGGQVKVLPNHTLTPASESYKKTSNY